MDKQEKLIRIVIISIVLIGNLVSIVGFIFNWALGLSCTWVWLVSVVGWGLLSGALGDLYRLEIKLNIVKE